MGIICYYSVRVEMATQNARSGESGPSVSRSFRVTTLAGFPVVFWPQCPLSKGLFLKQGFNKPLNKLQDTSEFSWQISGGCIEPIYNEVITAEICFEIWKLVKCWVWVKVQTSIYSEVEPCGGREADPVQLSKPVIHHYAKTCLKMLCWLFIPDLLLILPISL